MIADRELGHAGAERLDHARALVAQHDRQRHALPGAVGGVQAAVADAARGHAHQDFSLARGLERHLLHPLRLALLEENGCAHDGLRGAQRL